MPDWLTQIISFLNLSASFTLDVLFYALKVGLGAWVAQFATKLIKRRFIISEKARAKAFLESYKYFSLLRRSNRDLILWCTTAVLMSLIMYGFAAMQILIDANSRIAPMIFCSMALYLTFYFLMLTEKVRSPDKYRKRFLEKIAIFRIKPWHDAEVESWIHEAISKDDAPELGEV
jgi:hypothetical protein